MSQPSPATQLTPAGSNGAPASDDEASGIAAEAPPPKPPSTPLNGRGEPDWLREAFLTEEVLRYGRTLRDVLVRPATFAGRWVRGEGEYLNPVHFLAVSTAMFTVLVKVAAYLLGEDLGFVQSVLLSVVPYPYFLGFGLIAHFVVTRRRAPRGWTSTAAVALYVGGGPAALTSLTAHAAMVFLKTQDLMPGSGLLRANVSSPVRALLVLLSIATLTSFYAYFFPVLRGLHGVGRLRALLAVAVAFLSGAFLLGLFPTLELPGIFPFRLQVVDGSVRVIF